MKLREINLAEQYSFLANQGAAPRLISYLQDYDELADPTTFQVERPALLIIPGGAYTHYGPAEGDPVAMEFLTRGFQVFILYYSVKPYQYPQQILEVAAAMDYLHENAERLRFHPSKIAMVGFSAGGHLMTSYAALAKRPEITRHIMPKMANAAILGYPVIDYGRDRVAHPCVNTVFGHEITPEERADYSPLNIADETPPTFLWHTVGDTAVSVMNSIQYAEALIEKKIPVELHVYPAGGHGLSIATRQTSKDPNGKVAKSVSSWIPLVMTWLEGLFDL